VARVEPRERVQPSFRNVRSPRAVSYSATRLLARLIFDRAVPATRLPHHEPARGSKPTHEKEAEGGVSAIGLRPPDPNQSYPRHRLHKRTRS
jgi:hypothetical protein